MKATIICFLLVCIRLNAFPQNPLSDSLKVSSIKIIIINSPTDYELFIPKEEFNSQLDKDTIIIAGKILKEILLETIGNLQDTTFVDSVKSSFVECFDYRGVVELEYSNKITRYYFNTNCVFFLKDGKVFKDESLNFRYIFRNIVDIGILLDRTKVIRIKR